MNQSLRIFLTLLCVVFMGCDAGPKKSAMAFLDSLTAKGFTVKNAKDQSTDPMMAKIGQRLGGVLFTASVNKIGLKVIESDTAAKAKRIVEIERRGAKHMPKLPPEMAAEHQLDAPFANSNLILFVPGAKKDTPDAKRIIEAFKSF